MDPHQHDQCRYLILDALVILSDKFYLSDSNENGESDTLTLAKINNLNFHPLEVVARYRDPQLQVGKNYSYLFNLRPTIGKS